MQSSAPVRSPAHETLTAGSENPMFTKMLIAVALLATSSVALASDASYDQAQIRRGSVTSVEGGLPSNAAKSDVHNSQRCACSHHHS